MRWLVVAALTSVASAVELSMIDGSGETKAAIEEPSYSRVEGLPIDQQQGVLHNLPLKSVYDRSPEGTDLQWVGQITVGTPPQTL
jgi:hypothetical protein